MNPIATYTEVRIEGSRTFTLFPDKIVISGKQSLSSEFESSISLATLDPSPDKLRVRNQIFTWGMGMAVISLVAWSVLVSGFQISFAALPTILLACIGMAGFLFMLATWRKLEFVRFKNAGGIVILDIARAGKDAAKFASFADDLSKQIRQAKSAP